MNCIKIRKSGTFYTVFDDDCYVLYYLLDYKINNSRVGFPKSAFNKVINTLEENKVSYEVIGDDIKKNYKNLNNYIKYSRVGKEKYEKEIHYEDLKEKIKKISPDKLEKILVTIEAIIDE